MDPYAVLGVDAFASEAEIVRAFRRLVLEHHPDRNGGSAAASARLREIKAAYDAVRDSAHTRERRRSVIDDVRGTNRALDRDRVARVEARLPKVEAAIRAVIDDATPAALAQLIDVARWARLDVDNALALKGHVPDLRDAHWRELHFVDREGARRVLADFLAARPKSLDLVEMRNLRARLDGLLAVARGFHDELV